MLIEIIVNIHYVVETTNLHLSVDICLCCDQMLYYWKMALLAGNIQWCCTNLDVKNTEP